jgi:hypothetical protein
LDAIQLRRLRLLIEFELETLSLHLKHLAAADYPTDVAGKLIFALQGTIATHEKSVASGADDFDQDPRGAFERLQSQHRQIQVLYPYLRVVESAQTNRVPWSMIASLQRLASRLLPNIELLITCEPDFNFQISWFPKSAITGQIAQTELTKFYILQLPGTHRLDAFLHVLAGHELFHPIVGTFIDQHQVQVCVNMREPCTAMLKAQSGDQTLFDNQRLDELVEYGRNIWRRSMAEHMCDMGCAVLFGPSAILAISTFMLCFGLDDTPQHPSFYPSWRSRIRTLMRFVVDSPDGKAAFARLQETLSANADGKSIVKQLEERFSTLRSVAIDDTDQKEIQRFPLQKIALAQVDALLEDAWQFIDDTSRNAKVEVWHEAIAEVPHHLQAFRMSIPSAEVRSPGTFEGPAGSMTAIVLAAWLNQLLEESKGKSRIDLEDYMTRCRLLLKSVEDAELKRDFAARLPNLEKQ